MKTGLVMEGGGMRGLFTAGVLDVWMEQGLTFDGAVGVSAGVAIGCNFKSRQIGRAIRYNIRFAEDKRYKGISSLIKTGDIFGADFCYREIPQHLDVFDTETYRRNPMDFYGVATDVEKGIPVYKNLLKGDEQDLMFMRASASLPMVSRVVPFGDRKLLDGGITDSIPLKFLEGRGYPKNVVILTQPRGFVKHKSSLIPVAKLTLRDYPKMIECMAKRHLMYNLQTAYVAEREKEGAAFVIAPQEPLNIPNLERDGSELMRVYYAGREEALRTWNDLQAFLNR